MTTILLVNYEAENPYRTKHLNCRDTLGVVIIMALKALNALNDGEKARSCNTKCEQQCKT